MPPSSRCSRLSRPIWPRAADVVPHRDFLNYWNNAFGLNDVEFVAPKPRGRFRIMALGDSFTYGIVPYPDAVMTRVEEALRARCAGMDLDLLNFGIGGTGVWDYKLLFELAGPTFDPDLVVVNLYLGQRRPGPVRSPALVPPGPLVTPEVLSRSLRGQRGQGRDRCRPAGRRRSREPPRWSPPPHARGGEIVDAAAPLPPDDRQLTGPIYTRRGSPGSCGTSIGASPARHGRRPRSARGLPRSRSSTSSATRRPGRAAAW